MQKLIAVEGMEVEIEQESVSAVSLDVTTAPDLKSFCGEKAIFVDDTDITAKGVADGSFVVSDPVVLTLNATAKKVFSSSTGSEIAVLREGDTSGEVKVTGTDPSNATKNITFSVKITNAGQSKVFAS